jgi:uncharacterized membrane protein YgdD (TMEM256/DUF423 family)
LKLVLFIPTVLAGGLAGPNCKTGFLTESLVLSVDVVFFSGSMIILSAMKSDFFWFESIPICISFFVTGISFVSLESEEQLL